MKNKEKNWFVYILRCVDNTLYTGITTDLQRREREHNYHNKLGAKYTCGRRPVQVVYHEIYSSRAEAAQREFAIKKLNKDNKDNKDNKELLISPNGITTCKKD